MSPKVKAAGPDRDHTLIHIYMSRCGTAWLELGLREPAISTLQRTARPPTTAANLSVTRPGSSPRRVFCSGASRSNSLPCLRRPSPRPGRALRSSSATSSTLLATSRNCSSLTASHAVSISTLHCWERKACLDSGTPKSKPKTTERESGPACRLSPLFLEAAAEVQRGRQRARTRLQLAWTRSSRELSAVSGMRRA